MVPGRPLLYLSLPGVAFILGVFWYRRRNRNRAKDADIDQRDDKETKLTNLPNNAHEQLQQNGGNTITATTATTTGSKQQQTPTKSLNINGSATATVAESPGTKLFGKSAPIKIVHNNRNSPAKQQQQHHQQQQQEQQQQLSQQQSQIDSEILKSKIQHVEYQVLRSIDEDFENLSSPIDLPDSVNNRIGFHSRNVVCPKDAPVVIKATRTPKISPQDSFLETTYTKETLSSPSSPSSTQSQQSQQSEQSEADTPTPNAQDSSAETIEMAANTEMADELTELDDEKREVNAASPSLSLCSVQSGDSGKGSSLPRSEATRGKTTYEFFLSNSLVGQLYGRKRSYINQIKQKTAANVSLRKNRYPSKIRICVVEGTESQINAALAMIRQRLPSKRYPNFTMQRIHYALPQTIVPLSTESLLNLQLNLIEGINNDVVVSAVVTGGQIFVQHPLHPSHPSLAVLQKCLYDSYTGTEAPLLPGIEISAVCVLPVNGIWYRVQIIERDADDELRCVVKFLDFGGYMNVHFNDLRQIRSDFMGVPFQATECLLSNIEPIESSWSPEAADILCKLCKGIVLQAQVAGYNSHNIPEIYLFASLGPNNVIFINKELVARNLARWVDEVRD